jgi:enoyl-CoA hydratase/carnithine racemase
VEYVQSELTRGVAILRLNRPKANALNRAMISEMAEAFELAEREARAIVWSSAIPKFFSAGFDVNEVFSYDQAAMQEFLVAFSALQQRVQHSARPTVAALPGQTYAGGAILALSCDFRVMADGAYGFALTEVNIGVNLPEQVFHLLAASVGIPRARAMFLTGDPITPQDARASGLVSLVPDLDAEPRAIELARRLADKPPETYASIKRTMLRACGLAATNRTVADASSFFSDEAQQMKAQMAAKLAGSSDRKLS